MDEVSENRQGTGVRVFERERDGIANAEAHAEVGRAENTHRSSLHRELFSVKSDGGAVAAARCAEGPLEQSGDLTSCSALHYYCSARIGGPASWTIKSPSVCPHRWAGHSGEHRGASDVALRTSSAWRSTRSFRKYRQ